MKKRVLVIVPAYNEESNIAAVVASLREKAPACDFIVVNDCSEDATKRRCEEIDAPYIDIPVNLGIGGGVQTGFRYACERGYDAAVQFDGDGQHLAEFLPAIVEPVLAGECDLCIGSRFLEKKGFQTSAMRRFGINFLSFLIYLVCKIRVTDVTSGFRASSRALCEFFCENYAQDYPEPEAVMAASIAGFRVEERPVEMRERQGGKSSISPLKSVYFMIKVSLAILIGAFTGERKKR
ncbi:MAG: glycosyltransferase family 2 protein [Oscillospiraceae bacterium]|nr:glycosyltransferase family 2 protein [Oscillospiraceae bacterium]